MLLLKDRINSLIYIIEDSNGKYISDLLLRGIENKNLLLIEYLFDDECTLKVSMNLKYLDSES